MNLSGLEAGGCFFSLSPPTPGSGKHRPVFFSGSLCFLHSGMETLSPVSESSRGRNLGISTLRDHLQLLPVKAKAHESDTNRKGLFFFFFWLVSNDSITYNK